MNAGEVGRAAPRKPADWIDWVKADFTQAPPSPTEWVNQVKADFTHAALSPTDRALCEFAVKLTRTPWLMAESDISNLRSHDLNDRAIHDATQVISYFNYINRIAVGLHVDLEPGM